ncbi:DUF1801 domain-containing protein [Luteimonas sp. BDR2-5]|uniref:DUF1801 domain-containing protein n=1 Tax=Proluteimonas luteida TaxID=2878685 RepID=UPI001E52395C|nr:DUF1801 domain-containing protein [Luteimonas sp. BDR2-5]MCD9029006.1 DUF1801 domain-containing protein [Luteimonas sp. BDR2-5]
MTQSPQFRHATPADTSVAVDAFMATLDHPHADAVQCLRALVLGIDPTVAEGVKWNAPSWRTHEYFATTHLRAKSGIGLILHLGAKARALPEGGLAIDDPEGLLTWLGKDRASVAFADAAAVDARAPALQAVLRQWIAHV